MNSSTQNKDNKLRFVVLLTAVITVLLFIAITVLIIGSANPSTKTKDNSDIKYKNVSISTSKVHEGDLVLVNATYEYTFPETEQAALTQLSTLNPENYGLAYPSRTQLRGDALVKANDMLNEAGKIVTNTTLLVGSAYRSAQEQAEKDSSVKAGHSDSHTGLGFSVSFKDYTAYSKHTDLIKWFSDNAAKYGFIVRYPSSKSDITGISSYTNYFRYVGIAHATFISQYTADGKTNPCLEEYIAYIGEHPFEGEHVKIDVDGDNKDDYEVYFVKATTGTTVIQVPEDDENHPYTVSGNNIDGFIITVKL